MRRIALLLVLALAAPTVFAKKSGDTHARFPAVAAAGKQRTDEAVFEIACLDKTPQLSVVLFHPEQVSAFPYGEFEGPDGVGNERELARWTVEGAGPPVTLATAIGGWYGVDGDGYVFGAAAQPAKLDATRRLLEAAVAPGAKRLRLDLRAAKGDTTLAVSADLAAWRDSVARVAGPCLPVAP